LAECDGVTSSIPLPPPPPAPPPILPVAERRSIRKAQRRVIAIVALSVAVMGSAVLLELATRTHVEARGVPPTPPSSDEGQIPTTWICSETDRLLRAAEAEPVGEDSGVGPLETLVPTRIGGSFVLLGQQRIPDAETIADERGPVWLAELLRDGFRHGLIRAWQLPGETTASVHVYEFATRDGALAFQRFALEDQSCPYSHDVFVVDGMSGTIGLQIYWADGTESEQVSFVLGSRRYLANVRGPVIPERALVLRLSERLSRTAR
jgi:hypothetical protein